MSKKNETPLPSSSLEFLKTIGKNNNRDWFNANKEKYLKEVAHVENFAESLLFELNKYDVLETASGKKSLHRIYRDTRFTKDKIPYKTNWSGSFKRATKLRRGSYYFHIEPNNCFIAGGFWDPNPEDLKRIREDFAYNATGFRKILKNKTFKETFGILKGEQIKTTPRGFDPESPAIDLLRYRQFTLVKKFSDEDVLHSNFAKHAANVFLKMRPFLDYMSGVLTTDVNGIPTA